jgi:cellular nucleic acid-binding protein
MVAGSYAAAMAMNLDSNPYPAPKEIISAITVCEVCSDRKIPTKDWNAHKNSKAHRKNEDAARQAESGTTKGDNAASGGGWGGASNDVSSANWGASSGDVGSSGWGDSGFSGNDNSGFTNASSGRKFGGACYGCGQEGHSKRDCPQSGGGRGCFNCGQTG